MSLLRLFVLWLACIAGQPIVSPSRAGMGDYACLFCGKVHGEWLEARLREHYGHIHYGHMDDAMISGRGWRAQGFSDSEVPYEGDENS